jgi:hypothetical protein
MLLITVESNGQLKITGTVYDSTGVFPLEAASVLSSSGNGTITDKKGVFEINVSEKDSIWFSYLGKSTIKFPVIEIISYPQFNISLKAGIPLLQEVRIKPKDYRLDSIQNRIEYAKIFDYKKPSFKSIVTSIGITGITVDIDELIRAFQKRKIRSRLSFKQRLSEEEKNKFIDHRFTKLLVRKLTGLDGASLDSFMLQHRPAYEFVLSASEYDLRAYIIREYKKYMTTKEERTIPGELGNLIDKKDGFVRQATKMQEPFSINNTARRHNASGLPASFTRVIFRKGSGDQFFQTIIAVIVWQVYIDHLT